MGWFDEQIRLRKEVDDEVLSDAFQRLAVAVAGKEMASFQDSAQSRNAVEEVFRFYGYKSLREVPDDMTDPGEQLDYLCRPYGLMRRDVELTEGWYKDCIGPLLGFLEEDGTVVALLPSTVGYAYTYQGETVKLSKKTEARLSKHAICFYKSLPLQKLTAKDLFKYALETRSAQDYTGLLLFMGISTLIGLLAPQVTYFLYGTVVESQSMTLLFTSLLFLICVKLSGILFDVFKMLYNNIISTKMTVAVQAAAMMRVLSLPPSFFRKYASGDLSTRCNSITTLCSSFMGAIFNTGFTSLFSLAYIASILTFAPSLTVPALLVILLTVGVSLITTAQQTKMTKELMQEETKEAGLSFALLSGVQKIRLSGSEKRVFSRWANQKAKSAELTYHPPWMVKNSVPMNLLLTLFGTIIMYFIAVENQVSMAEYTAFNAAYTMLFGAFSGLSSLAMTVAQIKPTMELAKPLLDAEPETAKDKTIVTKLSGTVELNHVSFRYTENMPLVVNDLSLKIRSGQYIAIVGKTGCGKSTLVRLLLGFEQPQKGSIFFDGKDIRSLDLCSLRRHIGVVMQDGKLCAGDIHSNIALSAPWITLDETWEAADLAGIGDDIRHMPMGMNTVLSEGAGGISGGQRQRLLIARAVASKPNLLIFDEATSALDNITQKQVSDALDGLHCTRIIIAHRLSTIRHCDRILYMEDGKILEDGTYEELISQQGKFAELVERQRLDLEEA